MSQFTENDIGVHVWMPIACEHTLCGDAFDAPSSELHWEDGPFVETKKTTVSCPKCVTIINFCKTLKVRSQ